VKFYKDSNYEHETSAATLYIRVVNVIHVNSKRAVLKVNYLHKLSGRIQYTGTGITGYTDTIRILTEDFKYWSIRRAFKK